MINGGVRGMNSEELTQPLTIIYEREREKISNQNCQWRRLDGISPTRVISNETSLVYTIPLKAAQYIG